MCDLVEALIAHFKVLTPLTTVGRETDKLDERRLPQELKRSRKRVQALRDLESSNPPAFEFLVTSGFHERDLELEKQIQKKTSEVLQLTRKLSRGDKRRLKEKKWRASFRLCNLIAALFLHVKHGHLSGHRKPIFRDGEILDWITSRLSIEGIVQRKMSREALRKCVQRYYEMSAGLERVNGDGLTSSEIRKSGKGWTRQRDKLAKSLRDLAPGKDMVDREPLLFLGAIEERELHNQSTSCNGFL